MYKMIWKVSIAMRYSDNLVIVRNVGIAMYVIT